MITKEFVKAGKAIFTIEMPAEFVAAHGCKSHYTYKISYKPATDRWPETWWVNLLSGPDNTSDYMPIGKLNPDGSVAITRNSRYTANCWPYKVLVRVLYRLFKDEGNMIEAAGWKVHHEGRCCRCGRRLTVPESIETGIGPECANKM